MTDEVLIQKPFPEQTVDSESYWKAATEGRFELTRCTACGNAFHYARPFCPGCGSWDVESFDASGRGEIYSFTVIYRGPNEAFRDDVPYAIALVDTDEGARLFVGLKTGDPDGLAIGQKVEVSFEPRGDMSIPYFTPVRKET
jgi:uncharacterized OB-fold protein